MPLGVRGEGGGGVREHAGRRRRRRGWIDLHTVATPLSLSLSLFSF